MDFVLFQAHRGGCVTVDNIVDNSHNHLLQICFSAGGIRKISPHAAARKRRGRLRANLQLRAVASCPVRRSRPPQAPPIPAEVGASRICPLSLRISTRGEAVFRVFVTVRAVVGQGGLRARPRLGHSVFGAGVLAAPRLRPASLGTLVTTRFSKPAQRASAPVARKCPAYRNGWRMAKAFGLLERDRVGGRQEDGRHPLLSAAQGRRGRSPRWQARQNAQRRCRSGLNDRLWPKATIIGIRSERQLFGDKLPYTAIEHDGRIWPKAANIVIRRARQLSGDKLPLAGTAHDG